MKTILHLVSDLHLERSSEDHMKITKLNILLNKLHKKKGEIHILAAVGDISNVRHQSFNLFFEKVSPLYDHILYVPGNHEYYNDYHVENKLSMKKILDEMKKIINNYPNVKILDNNSIIINDYKFIGTTLWSNVDESSKDYIREHINDYHLIHTEKGLLTIADTNNFNKKNIKWLVSELKTDIPCIVLSHHAPLFNDPENNNYTADPKYTRSKNNCAFHNNLKVLLKKPIILWTFGHTHYCTNFILNGIHIISNQLGYENEITDFNPDMSIDLDIIL